MAEQKTAPESLSPPSHPAAAPRGEETGVTVAVKSIGLFVLGPIVLLLLIKWLMGV